MSTTTKIDAVYVRLDAVKVRRFNGLYNNLKIPISEEEYRKGAMDKLKEIQLDQMYSNYTLEELAVSHGYLISKC